jgi:hypothetical protein
MEADYTDKIRSFGALGYNFARIADLLSLRGKERARLILRLQDSSDPYAVAWRNGRAVSEHNVDAALLVEVEKGVTDAINALAERSRQRLLEDMKKEMFGI